MRRPRHRRVLVPPAAVLVAVLGILPAAAGGIGPGPGPADGPRQEDAPVSASGAQAPVLEPLAEGPTAAGSSPRGKIRVLEPLPLNELLKRTVLDERLFDASAPPVTVPAAELPPAVSPDVGGVPETVRAWAEAWSSREVDRYLSFYSRDFATPGGASRQEWESDRRSKIAAPGFIAVEVSFEQDATPLSPGRARVSFHQAYTSDVLIDDVRKTLELAREDGSWKIVEETSEALPGRAAEILRAVEGWAAAWSSQEVDRYLSFYSRELEVPGGATRQQWEDDRRQRISQPRSIAVEISSMSPPAGTEAGRFRLSFRQTYVSDAFSDVVLKTLELVREDGDWKIVREASEDWP